jgi:DNA-binding CsgD family transcriptional regulator
MAAVARRMGVSYETAKSYIDRVRDKYAALGRDVGTKTQLYAAAVEDGCVEP